jgi:hypothetical protein
MESALRWFKRVWKLSNLWPNLRALRWNGNTSTSVANAICEQAKCFQQKIKKA